MKRKRKFMGHLINLKRKIVAWFTRPIIKVRCVPEFTDSEWNNLGI